MKQYVNTEVIYNKEIAPGIFEMALRNQDVVQHAKCGQFIHLRVSHENLHILRRPISICSVNTETQELVIVYGVVGKGTVLLSEKKAGEYVEVLGPLGNGFTVSNMKEAVLVGGGIGVPPLVELAKQLKAAGTEKVKVFIGFRSQPFLLDEFKTAADEVYVATEDGSYGHQGYVTELIDEKTEEISTIFSCGPKPMLQSIQRYGKTHNIPTQLSTEERMACGIGACLVCVCKTKAEEKEEGYEYKRVCIEGPVFDGNDLILEEE